MATTGIPLNVRGAAAASPVSLTFVDWKSVDDTVTTQSITYTVGGNSSGSNPDFGAANANRYIVVGMGRRITGSSGPASVTVGGISASPVSGAYTNGGDIQTSDIWIAAVPTGTSGAITVDWGTSSTKIGSSIAVYRLITTTSTATTAQNATNSGTGNFSLSSMTVPANGAAMVFLSGRDGTNFTSPYIVWTNTSAANGDYVDLAGGRAWSSARVLVAGAVTVSIAGSPVPFNDWASASAAAWGP